MPSTTVHPVACSCCPAVFAPAALSSLPYIGVQYGVEGDAPLHLFNCTQCHSTIAIEIEGRS